MEKLLITISSVILTVWGIAHLFPTRNIVRGFGEIQRDNKLIITMEWIAEGLFLIFIGVLNFLITIYGQWQSPEARIVYVVSICFLFILAILSLFTGARTNIIPIKICPVVKLICALLIMLSIIM